MVSHTMMSCHLIVATREDCATWTHRDVRHAPSLEIAFLRDLFFIKIRCPTLRLYQLGSMGIDYIIRQEVEKVNGTEST